MTELNTPWSLHFDNDGTEDIAIIRDSKGEDLATSRPFWLPEEGDPVPPTLAAIQVMKAGPKLLEACETALHELRVRCGYKGDEAAYVELTTAIDQAAIDPTTPPPLVVIEVRGGVVVEVSGLPPGYLYEIIDHDFE